MSQPYVGPCCILSPADAVRVEQAMGDMHDPAALLVLRKLRACLESDPKWRLPLK